MAWSALPRFEWLLIDAVVLGVLVWQLVSVKREIRKNRQPEPPDSVPPPGAM
ncbi:MAG: hypothetical protein JOZ42_06065 [Acetobacteraceae bacterium]|nr:hypothetical protein [Acetobacteraceae bacterium]